MAWKSIERRRAYFRVYHPKWRRANPEKVKQYRVKQEATPKRKLQKIAIGIRYRAKNAERLRERQKRWRLANKEYIYFNNNQRSRKLKQLGNFTYKEWVEIQKQYNYKCACCHKTKKLTIDHIKPTSRGGLNIKENIQPLCNKCNVKKYTKEIRYENTG